MINMLRKYGIFSILPFFVLAESLLIRLAAGPHWLYTNEDPSYQYLVNGVRIIKGFVPNDIVHPGTSLQLLVSGVCWMLNLGRSASDVAMKVFVAPEFYLQAVYVILSIFYFLASIALAVYVFQKTNDRLAAFLSQLPSLGLYTGQYGLWHLSGECLLIVVLNLFSICFLMGLFAKTPEDEHTAALLWGIVAGLGTGEKITLIPLLVIPLIVLSFKNKFLFLTFFAASFIIFTFPIISKYPLFILGNIQLLTHLGHQGAGPAGIIEIHSYLSHWRDIIMEHWMYMGLLLSALFICIWKQGIQRWERGTFYLAAIVLGVMFQFAVVAKHPGPSYLLAGIGLFNAFLVLFFLQGPFQFVWVRRMMVVFILAFIVVRVWQTNDYRLNLTEGTKNILAFREHIHEKYKNDVFIGFYPTSEPSSALFLGDEYTGSFVELFKLYPQSLYLNRWSGEIINFKERVLSDDLLTQNPGVIFLGNAFDFSTTPFNVRLLEKSQFESAYLLTGTREKQALLFHQAALHFYRRGEDVKALACEQRAQALHYLP